MRGFEYTSGSSQKFWEIERDATSVTVRFGRIGTNGQTQVKAFDSEDAAIAHVDKLVAEKVKKGYVETDGTATPAAPPEPKKQAEEEPEPTALPDEDTFVIPVSWRRSILPRPGGVPGPAITVNRKAVDAAQAVIGSHEKTVRAVLTNQATDPAIAAAAAPYLKSGLASLTSELTPLGAAAVAVATAQVVDWQDGPKLAALTDAWVATRGTVFAATATVEIGALWADANRDQSAHLRWVRDDDSHYGWVYRWSSIAERTRHHVAAASDDELRQIRDALGGYRDGSLRQRLLTSFLLPGEREWVDADLAVLQPNMPNYIEPLLIATVGSVEQLDMLAGNVHAWSVARSIGVLASMVEGVGPAAAPTLLEWFDDNASDSDSKKRLLTILAALPTDEAFAALLERLDQKHVQPAVLEAMGRYPVRALRLLAVAAAGQSAPAKIAAELLRVHVIANPTVVDAVLEQLPPEAQERITAIRGAASSVAEAPADLLPPVLVTPPWLGKRSRPKSLVVDGLERPHETAIAWLPGERGVDKPLSYAWQGKSTWDERADQFRKRQLSSYHEYQFMAEAPVELARPLLANWQPKDTWYVQDYLSHFVARFELDALPLALLLAKAVPTSTAGALLPYAATDVADLMADWLLRLKSLRGMALAWFNRHPAVAARALIPAALGKAGPARRAAENALRVLATGGHEAHILEAANGYGPAAVDAIKAFLAIDPLELVPARIPTIPDWADPALLPPILLLGRSHALPASAVGHLCTILAMSKPGDVYAGLPIAKQACDPSSLAEFGWALFQRWQSVGTPSKEGWVLESLGWTGDDETVRRLAPIIRAWPGEGGHTRAVTGLEVLATIGTDVALMHLNGIAEKAKFKGLKERAQEKIAQVAEDLGLRPEELADRLVPDLGLDADGSLTLDYGPRQFTVGFDEHLKPYVADTDGKRLKDLPKPGTRDDAELAGAAYKRYVALKKDVRTIATDQIRRLEQAMVTGRRWTGRAFADLFVAHPLLWHIVRRLVWATFDDKGEKTGALRVAEDRSYADVSDDAYTLADDATVGIAHPLHLGESLAAWSEVFADYEILQPFPQLGRDIHTLTDAERGAATLARFAGVTVPTTKLLGLERRGWRRGQPQDAGIQSWVERELPGGRAIVINIEPGIAIGMVGEFPEQKLDSIWLNNRPSGDWRPTGTLRFGDLDPVMASELLRDLVEITA